MKELNAKGYNVSISAVRKRNPRGRGLTTIGYKVYINGRKNNIKKFYKDIDGKLYKMF